MHTLSVGYYDGPHTLRAPFNTNSAQADVGEPRANKAPPRPRTDFLLGLLGRTVLSVFYREIEVIGLENFPKSGAAIVVGNHNNSLIDAVVIASILPRMPRFLAASTVWDYKPIAPRFTGTSYYPSRQVALVRDANRYIYGNQL